MPWRVHCSVDVDGLGLGLGDGNGHVFRVGRVLPRQRPCGKLHQGRELDLTQRASQLSRCANQSVCSAQLQLCIEFLLRPSKPRMVQSAIEQSSRPSNVDRRPNHTRAFYSSHNTVHM